jgi:hypothetical protein
VSTATYSDQSSTAASGAVYEYEVTASLDGLESGRSNRDSGFAGSDLEIAISFDDPDNPSISIDAPATVAQGTALSVSASTGYVSYTWYLDGSDSHAGMTGSGSSISVETDGLTTGVHTLSLVVSDGANIYSAGVTFTVES